MRTTLDLPEKLLSDAMKASYQKTKTGAIIYALESFVQREKIQSLKNYKGKLDLKIDLDTLRRR